MPFVKIVRTHRYVKDIKKLKASAEDVDAMERMIAANPAVGALIQGLKGVRKARFRIGNRGKSGGGRVIYYVMMADDTVLMITAYAKAEKEDLSPDDRKAILRVLEELNR
jgi:mRNA-degrading endonuclease RelE of RelBE toxin-antitoxin system